MSVWCEVDREQDSNSKYFIIQQKQQQLIKMIQNVENWKVQWNNGLYSFRIPMREQYYSMHIVYVAYFGVTFP